MAKPPPPKIYSLHIPQEQEQRLLPRLKLSRKKRAVWLREAIEEKLNREEVEL
jgi:predicted DNA-binding protein